MSPFIFKARSSAYVMLFFRRINPRWLIFIIDVCTCLFSISLAFLLRFNFNIAESYYPEWFEAIVLVMAVRILSFIIGRTYAGIIRYTSVKDIFRVFFVVASGSIFLALAGLFNSGFLSGSHLVPYSVIVIDFITTFCIMILLRLTVKVLYIELSHMTYPKTNVIIFGSKELAVLSKRALELDIQHTYNVVAFISTSDLTLGKQLEGVNVYPVSDLKKIINKTNADQLLFASTKIGPEIQKEIVQICLNNQVKVFTIPGVNKWINGDLKIKNLKKLNIEDLLSREPINLDPEPSRETLQNKTVLVTGAAGSIGSEIVQQILQFGIRKVIAIDQAETPMFNLENELSEAGLSKKCEFRIADITSEETMRGIFESHRPEIVYHCAAYKHVPLMEANPAAAFHNNILGTKIMADLASAYGVSKFVFISTDKAVNPTNIMGASKRIAEMYTQALNKTSYTSFITTRFGNVLGSNGSVIPLFRKQIDSGGPVTVTHPEVTRYFMTIPEACQLVIEASAFGKGGEIFVFNMGQSVKIIDLAKNMIKLAGLEPEVDIRIKFTGLRPGEKLYEELLHQSEDDVPTHHPKIMIATVREQDIEVVNNYIKAMAESVELQNNNRLVTLMKELVPEFISRNSVYEQLDKNIQFIKSLS